MIKYTQDQLREIIQQNINGEESKDSTIVITRKNNIFVVNKTTIEAVLDMNSKSIGVLNMASNKRKGGGVLNGAVAQEEDLYRCTNMYNLVSDDFYPLDNKILFTEDVKVIRDSNYMYLQDPVNINVITSCMVNLNTTKARPIDYHQVVENKIEELLQGFLKYQCTSIVLGAWGCGVFKNKPEDIAKAFYRVLMKGYRHCFDEIIFAIAFNEKNYNVFRDQFIR